MAIVPVTPDSLESSPRELLTKIEQDHALNLIQKGRRHPWTEAQRRYAASLQMKARGIEGGTWVEIRRRTRTR
jgi:hypothetical protein